MDANIPGYAVINRMGEGGMASVYLAYQQNLERRVALKVLHPELAENQEYCARFLREAKIGASLCHRNIVPVYEVGRFKNFHYLTMEYLPNGDLKQRLVRGCDTHTVLRIIYDIAAALGYAHSKSYIHRDIKPENIMFREDMTAVLTDFGVAVDVSATGGSAMRQQIAGSPQYMSPEHAKAGKLDFRSDIYSLGAVMFEALAGRPVVEPSATLADAVRRMDEPLPGLPSQVSWLQPVLDRMLAKNANDRFDDMGEVMHALEPCIEASGALSGGPRRRQQVADDFGARQRNSEDFSSQPRTAEPVAAPQPARDDVSPRPRVSREPDHRQREATDELLAHRRAVEELIYRDREREPVLTPSAPTMVVDASEDLAAALASCPPLVSPPPDRASLGQHRSRVGILLLVLGVVAVPLAWYQWPSLREDIALMLSPAGTEEDDRTAQLSGAMERQAGPFELPSEPAGAIPDSGMPTIVDTAPEPLSHPSTADTAAVPGSTTPASTASAASTSTATTTTATSTTSPQTLERPSTDTATIADAAPQEPAQVPEEDLLQQADSALQAVPPTQENLDNAYAKFREVLALSPSNRDARQGLTSVASRYIDLASAALNRDQLKSAQEYLDLASKISTRHSLGSHLRDKISNMQYALNRLYQLQTQPTAQPYRDARVNWDD